MSLMALQCAVEQKVILVVLTFGAMLEKARTRDKLQLDLRAGTKRATNIHVLVNELLLSVLQFWQAPATLCEA